MDNNDIKNRPGRHPDIKMVTVLGARLPVHSMLIAWYQKTYGLVAGSSDPLGRYFWGCNEKSHCLLLKKNSCLYAYLASRTIQSLQNAHLPQKQ